MKSDQITCFLSTMLAGLTISTSAPRTRSAFTFSSATSSGIIMAETVNSRTMLNVKWTNLHRTLYSTRLSVECTVLRKQMIPTSLWQLLQLKSPLNQRCLQKYVNRYKGAENQLSLHLRSLPWVINNVLTSNKVYVTYFGALRGPWRCLLDWGTECNETKLTLRRNTYLYFSQNLNAQSIAQRIYSY